MSYKKFLDVKYEIDKGRYTVLCKDDKQLVTMFLSRSTFNDPELMSAWLNSLYSMAHHNAPRVR